MIISLVSQKGGVGKSTLARVIATEFRKAGWEVKIADLDPAQGTSTKWSMRRDEAEIDPEILVQKYRDPERALKDAENFDLMIMDGPAHAGKSAAVMARSSDLVLFPTGYSLDDLDAQVQLAYDLQDAGISSDKFRMVFSRARGASSEDLAARTYVTRAQLLFLDNVLRELPSIRQAHAAGKSAAETGFGSVDNESKALITEIATLLTQGA